MDRISMLLVALSKKYKVNIVNFYSYDPEEQRFNNKYRATIKNRSTDKLESEIECYGKRSLLLELMKWVE